MAREALKLKRRIDSINQSASSLTNDELRSELAKHLCVLSSGLLEATIRDSMLVLSRQRRAHARISNAANTFAKSIQSPNRKNIQGFLSKIDARLAEEFQELMKDERIKSGLNSIVSNRHLIAHGRDCGISLSQINDYLSRIKPVLECIEKIEK